MSDKEKQDITNNVMHEKLIEYIDLINIQFREPATGIFASLPMLVNNINNQNTEKAIENLHGVYKNTYAILKGINNISVAAKFLGNYQFTKNTISFSELVNNVFSGSKIVLPGYLKINLDVEEGCFVEGNSMLLTVALLNLLLNSFDYRQGDNVQVHVSLKKENGRCVLVYRDNSIGIKPHIAQEIFNPFFTVNPFDDGEQNGNMGIGLYIAQQAIKHAGGTILLQTEFSEGVSYLISIPDHMVYDDNILRSSSSEMLLNRYSDIFIQLCEYCSLPDL
ncbi:MAG: HAMP domain-containing histidine kinase [Ruminococcaceae bacterium]|nr:HAMP domain-containing histidine kinase [Oscillospiraceae bacterium]